MTLIEEAIDRMLEAERDVTTLSQELFRCGKTRQAIKQVELDAAVERRERYRRAILEAFDAFTPKPVQHELTRTERRLLQGVNRWQPHAVVVAAISEGGRFHQLVRGKWLSASPRYKRGAMNVWYTNLTLTEKGIRELCHE